MFIKVPLFFKRSCEILIYTNGSTANWIVNIHSFKGWDLFYGSLFLYVICWNQFFGKLINVNFPWKFLLPLIDLLVFGCSLYILVLSPKWCIYYFFSYLIPFYIICCVFSCHIFLSSEGTIHYSFSIADSEALCLLELMLL